MKPKHRFPLINTIPVAAILAVIAFSAVAKEVPKQLPDPDGKPADMAKPVQVYILLGQSNMLGFGPGGRGAGGHAGARGEG